MKRITILAGAAIGLLAPVSAAQAAQIVTVQAQANSSSGGAGANTGISTMIGQTLIIGTSVTDLWSAGALPRWSNANGLIGPLFATGTDETGLPAGTQIGTNFGTWTQDGFTAPYGALVGKIGNTYQLLGTSFNGAAWGTGTLQLFYWDSNSGDNSSSIDVRVAAVPEPAMWAMMIFGFAMAGFALRRREKPARVSVKFN